MKENIIFGGIKLPVAFNEEENNYYYREYLNGNMYARDILIENNLRLVYFVAKNYLGGQDYDIEDIVSIGIIGLIKAIDTFDIDRNVKLSTYIYRCIKTEIYSYLRDRKRCNPYDIVSFDETFMSAGLNEYLYGELYTKDIYCVEEYLIQMEEQKYELDIIKDLLNSLNERNRKIIMLYFGFVDGRLYSQREIAEIVDIGRAGVSRVILSTLDKARSSLKFMQKFDDLMVGNDLGKKKSLVRM